MWLTSLLFNEVALLLGTLLFVFYLWVKSKYRYFEKRGIPYAPGTFPLGTIWEPLLLKKSMAECLNDLYRKHKADGPILGFLQPLGPAILITDPALATKICIKDFSHFQDHGVKVDEEVNPLEGHLFNLNGAKWRTLRNKLTPVFSSGKLKWMFETMNEVTDHLIQHMSQKCLDKDVEARDLLARFTTDVIGSCAFGLDPGAINDPNSEFRKMGRAIFRPPTFFFFKNILRFFCPELIIKMKLKVVPDNINNFFTSITKQAFDHRLNKGTHRKDFIQLLLQLREKGSVEIDQREEEEDEVILQHQVQLEEGDKGKLKLTDELLTAQSFVFFGAGFETSAAALSFTLYFLAKNPEIQERARAEVREKKSRYGGITYDSLSNMIYLQCCIHESMRIRSPIGIMIRECTKAYRLEDGTLIEEGMKIFIPNNAFQIDPEYFPNPDTFDPERFMPGRSIYPGSFTPFGEGPRVCIAQRFALLELRLGLAKILDNFQVITSTKQLEPLKMDPKSFFPSPIGGTWLIFKQIN